MNGRRLSMKDERANEARKELEDRTEFFRQLAAFNEDMIQRKGLPKDVKGLLHDLCYHHDGRDVYNYVERAQSILKRSKSGAEGRNAE